MRQDTGQSVPEEEKYRGKLQSAISVYLARTVEEHSFLENMDPEELSRAKEQALFLAMQKIASETITPDSPVSLEDIVVTSVHAAMKEQVPWMYYEDLPDVFTGGLEDDPTAREKSVQQLVAIIEANYQNKPTEFRQAVLKSFREALQNPDSHFTVVRKEEEVIAFCRFDYHYKQERKHEDDDLEYIYFGSVNLNPKFKDSRMGEAMIQKAFFEVLDDSHVPLRADSQAYGNTGRNYVEKYGFVAERFYDLHGVPSFGIVESRPESHLYVGKKMQRTDIVSLYQIGQTTGSKKVNYLGGGSSVTEYRIESYEKNHQPHFNLLAKGYVLTRYFVEDEKMYCVFEKIRLPGQTADKLHR